MVVCIDFFEMSEICRPKFIVRHSTFKNSDLWHNNGWAAGESDKSSLSPAAISSKLKIQELTA
jgi:hypothetical protein